MQIQKLGIELRRIGNTESLFKEVDLVLSKYDLLNSQTSKTIQVQTVAHALQKMFKTDNHFSVCAIRSCIDVAQIHISEERMSIYSSIHCMNWSEMLPDYRQMITAMILDDFKSVLTEQKI